MKSKIPALSIMLSALLALAACGENGGGSQQGGAAAPPAIDVVAVPLKNEDVPLFSELPGRTNAYRVAEVRPQVTGIILKRLFEEGSMVEAGDQLYQIDPATYEAAFQSARADLASARANLKSVQALAARYAQLVKINAVSRQNYDNAVASADQAKAQILTAEAAVETARINLDYTKVYAPISGRIGSSNITEGALATANQTSALTQITQLDPIYVDVRQSSSELLQLRAAISKGEVQGLAQSAKVTLLLDGSDYVYPTQGELQFSDVTVDPSSGAVQVRIKFDNSEGVLYPGLFVRARIEQGIRENAILAPQQAVMRQADGSTAVWRVVDGKAVLTPVAAGQAVGDKWLILSGLSDGDSVIIEGLQKIRGNNVPVNAAAPNPPAGNAPKSEQQ